MFSSTSLQRSGTSISIISRSAYSRASRFEAALRGGRAALSDADRLRCTFGCTSPAACVGVVVLHQERVDAGR